MPKKPTTKPRKTSEALSTRFDDVELATLKKAAALTVPPSSVAAIVRYGAIKFAASIIEDRNNTHATRSVKR